MKYADAYVSLLLLTGNGSIIIFNRNKEEFQRPPVESIKSILNHIESGPFSEKKVWVTQKGCAPLRLSLSKK